MMSDGIVFLPCVFLSALWFGRPPLTISITTISSSSRHRGKRKGSCLFQPGFLDQLHVRIIYPLSLQCPICQLTDKAQMFLTCQFWCQQLCFICSQIPGRVKYVADKAQTTTQTQPENEKLISWQGTLFQIAKKYNPLKAETPELSPEEVIKKSWKGLFGKTQSPHERLLWDWVHQRSRLQRFFKGCRLIDALQTVITALK